MSIGLRPLEYIDIVLFGNNVSWYQYPLEYVATWYTY